MTETLSLHLQKAFKHAEVAVVEGRSDIAVVTATKNYIPMDEFKSIFLEVGNLVSRLGVKKLIFDKRALTIFHQPSMEWYFIEWKEKMYHKGLKTHRKILPNDKVFRQSVKIGRAAIEQKLPNGKYKDMDIRYFETLEEAVEH